LTRHVKLCMQCLRGLKHTGNYMHYLL
jgi:hypothetical protein